ncbi:MAG: tRNA lysidine(34) synthetase TilS [Actinomycetota bacterium]|nr:tRNA lysidine(34) synthetase TilS [Actinomycetota bacterium]
MEPAEFPAAIERTVRRFVMDLSQPLAMVSGGPDSVALLRVLVELGARPVVLHVNHMLRGGEASADAEFVRELCEELGLVYEERRAKFRRGNLQQEARKERYRFAERIAEERMLSAIATGHTADDVAETVLLNLARGAGLKGLSGIPPVRGRVVRPLIRHRRHDILRYLDHLGQPYRTDRSNLTPKYARNRVRLEVLPILEELYPGAASNIARGASLLREDLEVLEGLVAEILRWRGEEVIVPLDELWSLPPALRRHAVRVAYTKLASGRAPLGSATVEEILELARKGDGTQYMHLPENAIVAARYDRELAFYHGAKLFFGEKDLLVGEQNFYDWSINLREVRGYDPEDAVRPEVAYLDASRGPYRVRLAREGDTIRPLGLGGTKKVYKAMMDRKVPEDLRSRVPIVVDAFGRVAWIFLGEVGEEFKVNADTEKALRLEVERIP